ncbi:hypothetical protein ZIOFF_071748 [Zingiber officinale]|uniref:Pentatricopeptide repeat-containing protein n=2 Tax=Zingiber officinale TaxID=94328 RepID=A0A8J5ETP6_ZINOF|nr:hypothetical protein ZIOFF_071748 [Zingiber officinale]
MMLHFFPHYSSPFVPSHYIFLLDRCAALSQVKQIQAPLVTLGLHTNPFLVGKLVEILAIKLPLQLHLPHCLPHALLLFSHSHQTPNLFTWNTLIRALSLGPQPLHALHLFAQMLRTPPLRPDGYSYAYALKACARLRAREAARAVHGLMVVAGSDLSGGHATNSLMHAYASCGEVGCAGKLFDAVPAKEDVIAWNVMLSCFAQNGLPVEAMQLSREMWSACVAPTDVTMISVLSACSQVKEVGLGRQIHGRVCKRTLQFEKLVNLGTALIDMYAKCGCLLQAKQVFDEMRVRDVGVWNALLGAYVHNGFFTQGLQVFDELQRAGLTPDGPTLVTTLTACGHAGMLDAGKNIHAYLEERFPYFDAVLGTSLIEMYSKCGCTEGARQVFDKMPKRDVMAWSAMIRSLAVHGHSRETLELFHLMQRSGVRPDAVTFVAVLNACSHAGLVEDGLSYFRSMQREFGISPRVEHYGCLIDLLSRAGKVREALELVRSMEGRANEIVWRSLLSACRVELDVEVAEIAVAGLRKLRSEHCGDYVLLSNIYAGKGMWNEAIRVRKEMKEGSVRKIPAFSLINSGDHACA